MNTKEFYADKEKKLAAMDPAAELKEQIRKNLITAGGFP